MKPSLKLFLLILFLKLFFTADNSLFPQTPPYYHYTSTEGLASSTLFSICQSKDGYLWFATSHGISRFDGRRFKNYGMKDGLYSDMITCIIAGQNGEIYIGNYEKGINIMKDGIISNYTNPGKGIHRINYLFKDGDNLYGSGTGALVWYNNGQTNNVLSPVLGRDVKDHPILYNRLIMNSGGVVLVPTTHGIYSIKEKEFKEINIKDLPNSETHCIYESNDGRLFAGSIGEIYEIKDYRTVRVIKTGFKNDKITNIMIDSRNNMWFSVFNKGFYLILSGSDKILNMGSKLGIEKTIVNNFFEDNENNIWVTTFGEGVFCINNFYFNKYNEEDGLISNHIHSIAKNKDGSMLIGTMNGINILSNGKIDRLELESEKIQNNFIYEMKLIDDKVYVCVPFHHHNIVKKFYNNTEFVLFGAASFCRKSNNDYIIGTWGNVIHVNKKDDLSYSLGPSIRVIDGGGTTNRINKIFEDSEKNLWIGTGQGLCRIKNGEKKLFPENEILNASVKFIIQDNKDVIWFAGEKGVASYNLQNDSFSNISLPGCDLSSSTSLAIDKYNRLWIGNTKGLYLMENNLIRFLNSSKGLPSNEISSLFYDNEKNIMWIGTNNGFCSFDIELYDSYKFPPLNIKVENIRSGDSVYTVFNDLSFEPENNDIHILYSVTNFSSPASLQYQYKFDREWKVTETDLLDFKSIEKGQYNVSFRARILNGEWSEPSLVSFIVKPKFFETTWFQLSLTCILGFIVFFTARYRINSNKEKNTAKLETTKRMFELRHQALSAMMNPHFIFNSLNSVQYLVNKGRKDEANDYISRMAMLIRKNLDTAGTSFIVLNEEISRLKLYLEIEKLRFQDKFFYEINAGDNVDTNSVMIPNMIIQPFVENAVWHGIMNSGRKGFVKISFNFENVNIETNTYKCLVIKITDNGIGLKKSAENKKDGHISKGIKIIEERLQILSQEFALPQPVIIEDLSMRVENSTGTEVIISLPHTLFRNISEEPL